MTRDASGKFTGPDIFGDAMRKRVARSAIVPEGDPIDPDAKSPEDQPATPPGGFGGGAGVQDPGAGESLGDTVRRHVFGG